MRDEMLNELLYDLNDVALGFKHKLGEELAYLFLTKLETEKQEIKHNNFVNERRLDIVTEALRGKVHVTVTRTQVRDAIKNMKPEQKRKEKGFKTLAEYIQHRIDYRIERIRDRDQVNSIKQDVERLYNEQIAIDNKKGKKK